MQLTHRRAETGTVKKKTRKELTPIIPALAAIIGVIMLLYPVFATQHNDYVHQQNARRYSVDVKSTDPAVLKASLDAADEYNASAKDRIILDPFLRDIVPNTPEYQAYLKQLSVFDAMSQIKVPSANIDLPIYHGTEDHTLTKGVGHLFGTSLPVGGPDTHTVLTGHTGLSDATLFNGLKDVRIGDPIYLNTEGREMKYIVNDIKVVLPTEVDSLRRVPGKDLVTLITCTPYGINSHRLLVTGERAPLDPSDIAAVQAETPIVVEWKWWMIALIVIAAISVIVVGVFFIQWIRALRAANKKATTAADMNGSGDAFFAD